MLLVIVAGLVSWECSAISVSSLVKYWLRWIDFSHPLRPVVIVITESHLCLWMCGNGLVLVVGLTTIEMSTRHKT